MAAVSNGTAVLGLGNIGAAAGKPVMEGKGVFFKRFAASTYSTWSSTRRTRPRFFTLARFSNLHSAPITTSAWAHAMLSFSNFGSARHVLARKARRATELARVEAPWLKIEGEMQADTAVSPEILSQTYPFAMLPGGANG